MQEKIEKIIADYTDGRLTYSDATTTLAAITPRLPHAEYKAACDRLYAISEQRRAARIAKNKKYNSDWSRAQNEMAK